jgi:signal transduction histidine kinase
LESVTSPPEYEVLILAPTGRDAPAAIEVFSRSGIAARAIPTLSELCRRLEAPAGVVLIAEEALTYENVEDLKHTLSRQAQWSNLPVILMTSQLERLFKTEQILAIFGASGAVSLLERPFRIVTLLAAVRVALQAREKQYQVRELLKEQALALQQRDEFLSIASHELKTPITSLKLQVQLRKRYLQRGDLSVFSPQKVISLIQATETQLERLSRLVDDMLDISRIANGKLSLTCQVVELGELVKEVLEAFSPQFQAAGCTVDLQIETQVYGHWDRYRVEQVIANLFTNAIKYGAGKPVLIRVKMQERLAVLLVKDRGIGIAPENQARIFQRFERAVVGNAISGLGLGLYITRQILDLHSGKITVESAVGEGSTFTVHLPTQSMKGSIT